MKRFLQLLPLLLLSFIVKGQEVFYEYARNHSFIENKGQWPEDVFFKNKIDGGNMWVQQGGILFQLQDYSKLEESHASMKPFEGEVTFREALIKLQFVGALNVDKVEKKGKSEYYYNYFIGNDKSKWASEVYSYDEFNLKNLYSGIDLHFVAEKEQLKYEFIVSPNSQPNQIQLKYSFHKGLKINRNGDLIIQSELGEIIEKKPYAYQIINGKITEVQCNYELSGNIVKFKLGDYNKRVALVIDPVLVFATYSGALSDNFGMTATYGYDGTAFNGGTVYGNSFPMPDPNSYNTTSNMTVVNVNVVTTDAFISRYSADGTAMLWSTFFGGGDNTQGTDLPHSLICDQNNNIYVFGTTSSLDLPIVNGFQTTHGGGTPLAISYNGVNFGTVGSDMYVAKFSANGHNLLGSTYVGGDQNDGVNYMISGGNYGNPAAYDSLSTNYGDQFRGEIMLDSMNNIIVGSCSRSANFPTANAFQSTLAGESDGVLFKIKNDFTSLLFSSFFGGTKQDAIYSVKIDSSYNMVFSGGTTSLDLSVTPGAYQSSYNGGTADGFIGKLSPDGTILTHATYIGTPNYDQTFFVEIDRLDNVFVLGQSNGGSFPVISAGYSNPNSSQFIAKLNPDLTAIMSSTVFGSGSPTFDISPSAFLVDICGNMYVSGWGGNVLQGSPPISGMPVTPDAFQSTPPNGYDFYLTVLDKGFNGLLYGSYLGGHLAKEHVDGGTSRFDKNGVVYQCVCGGCGGHSDFPTTPGAWSNQNLNSNCNALLFKFDFNLIPNAEFTIDQSIGCTPFVVEFTNFSSDSDTYMWDFGNGVKDSLTFEPIKTYTVPGTYHVMLTVTDSICLLTDTAYITIEVYPDIDLEAITDIYLCNADSIILTADANGSASSFVWSDNINFTNMLNPNTSDSIAVVFNPSSDYYYVKASNNGCNEIDSVFVNYTIAEAHAAGDVNLGCTPLEVNFSHTSTDFDSFVWDFDNGNSNSTSSDPTVIFTLPGTYEVLLIVKDINCNIPDTSIVTIEVYPSITLTTTSDFDLCEPIPISLEANTNGTADHFIWSTNANFTDTLNNPLTDSIVIINNPVEGYYYVLASNDGCSQIDSVRVHFTSSDLSLVGNTNLCLGDETVITAMENNPLIHFTNFIWSPSSIITSGNGTNSVTVRPNNTQYLYITANASNGCTITDSILISVSDIDESTVFAFASDSIIPEGQKVTLWAEPDGYSYLWFPSGDVDHPNAQETDASVHGKTEFIVFVTDGICAKSASVWVATFPYTCSEPYIFVPNAFSPNGDGDNDILYVRSMIIRDMVFRIYDRWGEKVYESTSMHNGWDGTFRDKKLKPDVYDYYLDGHCIDGQEFLIKGNITLIR